RDQQGQRDRRQVESHRSPHLLDEHHLPLFLRIAFAQVEPVRALADHVGTHHQLRITVFARPGLGGAQQGPADPRSARGFVHDQPRELRIGIVFEPPLRQHVRPARDLAVDFSDHHRAGTVFHDVLQPPRDRLCVSRITEFTRQTRQRSGIGRGRGTDMDGAGHFDCLQCSATTFATTIDTRLPVGMCRNSFGPCALECGPSTPVIKNCACGNFSPSIPMKGMLPPSPMYAGGAPKAICEASATAFSSHGESCGAFQPLEAFSSFSSTWQPQGGSLSSNCLTNSPARTPSSVGGRRSESFTAVNGRNTLPALESGGRPSAPVTASCGRQVRFNTSSVRSSATGFMPGRNGNLSYTAVPSTSAHRRACSMRCAGTSAYSSRGLIAPVAESSSLES